MAGFTGVRGTRQPSPLVDSDPGERIKDMDHEGVDVNLTLPSGWFGTPTLHSRSAVLFRHGARWVGSTTAILKTLFETTSMIFSSRTCAVAVNS
jgi:hypothetical protein